MRRASTDWPERGRAACAALLVAYGFGAVETPVGTLGFVTSSDAWIHDIRVAVPGSGASVKADRRAGAGTPGGHGSPAGAAP